MLKVETRMGMNTMAAVVWQSSINDHDAHLLMIFVGVAAFALLAQSLVIVGVAIGGAAKQKELIEYGKAMTAKIDPLIAKTDALVTDLGPQLKDIGAKVAAISANVENISGQVREKITELGPTISATRLTIEQANDTVREANLKTRQQVVRVNGMVSTFLDATAQVGRAIQHGIDVPVREANAIVDGVRTALNTFIRSSGKPKRPVYRPPIGTYTANRPEAPQDSYPPDRPELEG